MTRTMERTPAAKMSATARMPARLQRKCACGGTPASSGECEKCKTRSEAATRHPIRMRKQLAITSPGDAFEMEADSVDRPIHAAAGVEIGAKVGDRQKRHGSKKGGKQETTASIVK